MFDSGLGKKRGRPAKYASPEEKARADVDRRREARRKEAHERRERIHREFYEGEGAKPKLEPRKEVKIIIEHPERAQLAAKHEEQPVQQLQSIHLLDIDEFSSYCSTDEETHPGLGATRTRTATAKPAEPALCEEQLRLVELILSGDNVFYTGGAGTGKSTVLRAIVRQLQQRRKRVWVVTPTGISALNVSGSTYFTYAGWNPGVMKKSIEEIRTMAMSKERRQRIRDTDVLIIDEISMLEANQFQRLDQACQAARGKEDPFGGIQVIVTGDFYQLPPVKAFQTCYPCGTELRTRAFCRSCQPGDDDGVYQPPSMRPRKDCLRCRMELAEQMDCPSCKKTFNTDDQWAFRSGAWQACRFKCVSLTQVHRQSDQTFINILNTLRVGEKLNERQLSLLNAQEADVGDAIELSPVRREVDRKNLEGFQAIEGAVRAYKCRDYVDIRSHHPHLASKAELDADGNRMGCREHRFPALLETKFGMPVILLSNIDVEAGLVNGSQGRIVGYSPHKPLMSIRERKVAESGDFSRLAEHEIVTWTGQQTPSFPLPVVRFENEVERAIYPVFQDTELGDPPPFSIVARTQIPLLPAWAITIHKSQGMTLEKAVVNLEHIFEPQMAYVALSRVRSLKGLKVTSGVGLKTLQERGRLGDGSSVVRAFMQGGFA